MARFSARVSRVFNPSLVAFASLSLSLSLSACVAGEEPELVGSDGEAIINGTPETAEGSGFVVVSGLVGSCSGTLIRNAWILTAAHCIDAAELSSPGTLSLSMGSQSRVADSARKHGGVDVALIHVSSPFTMNGTTYGYEKGIYAYDTPRLVGATLACDGYGLNTPTSGFGTLRHADIVVSNTESNGYRLSANSSGQIQWRGDSGGSCSFARDITGVQSTSAYYYDPATGTPTQVVSAYQEGAASFRDWVLDALDASPSGPTVTAGGGTMAIYERGTDDALWQLTTTDGYGWGSWYSLAGILTSEPAATVLPGNVWSVFVRGTDNALYQKTWSGAWSSWSSVGSSTFSSAPAATTTPSGKLYLFARSLDNSYWMRTKTSTWSVWTSLGGPFSSAPAATSDGAGNVYVFGRGLDAAVWTRSYSAASATWSGWASLDGYTTSTPAAATDAAGKVYMFARGGDNAIWYRTQSGGGWSSWSSLGGIGTSAPSAVYFNGQTHVVVRGTDGRVFIQSFNGSSWSGWRAAG